MSKIDETVDKPDPEASEHTDESTSSEDRTDAKSAQAIERVFIVPYPKVVFLYPTFLCGLVAAIWMSFLDPLEGNPPVVLSSVFLMILAINLIVLTLDFPRATSLTLFFIGATSFLGLMLMAIMRPDWLPVLRDLVSGIRPAANATFFWVITGLLGGVFVVVKVKIQFDYWEVRRNELLHHHGVLSDLRRYPTAGLQVNKEINDVFEYLLLRSGTLTLRPQGENRMFVLENVPMIGAKEEKITRLLSAMRVKVQMEGPQ